MRLDRVHVTRVRNLSEVSLQPNPRINLIHGRNGAGKTAILESIHLLSDARTFRHSQIRPLIQDGAGEAVVHGELTAARGGTRLRIGVAKQKNGQTGIRCQGRSDLTAVALARQVPLLALVDQGDDWVRGGSKGRRRMLDWGLFHVEHRFYPAWQRMRQAVKQRNRLIRHGIMDASRLEPWDRQICLAARELDDLRSAYFESLNARAAEVWDRFLGAACGLSLRYSRGWDADRDLDEVLSRSVSRDLSHGYTTSGPHRADLLITSPMGEPERVLSRGQLKMAYWGLRLAQLALHGERTGEPALCLVDDLPAELDRENQARMLGALWESGSQVFITALEQDLPLPAGMDSGEIEMFHVKQGVLCQGAPSQE